MTACELLTFPVFRERLRYLPAAARLALFLDLPQRRQDQAWTHLREQVDAARELALTADEEQDGGWREAA
jgi:hypothetical protein